MISTATFISRNRISFIVLATLTSAAMSSSSTMVIMNPPVRRMLTWGVPKRRETFPSTGGSRPSRLMAMGLREAARMPLLPVVTKARMAAADSSTAPPRPRNFPAARLSGVRLPYGPAPSSAASVTPTTTNTAAT